MGNKGPDSISSSFPAVAAETSSNPSSANISTNNNNGDITPFLNIAAWICAGGSLLFGYTTGVINGALPFLIEDLHLSPAARGVVISSLLVGAAFGSLLAGRLADWFGRKWALFGCTLLYIVGTVCSSLAPDTMWLIILRLFLGLTIGGFGSVVNVLLAEFSPAGCRARMVTRSFLCVMVGEFFAFGAGALLGIIWQKDTGIWRWMCVLGAFPAVVELGLICWIVPESPRWLISAGKIKEARTILRRIRCNTAEADSEWEEIQALSKKNDNNGQHANEYLSLLRQRWFLRLLLIGIGVGLCMSTEAGAIIMYYGTVVLRDNNGQDTRAALLENTANGVVSLLACAVGLWLVGRVPRRPMLFVAVLGSAVPHSLIGLACWLLPDGPAKGYVVLTGMLAFLVLQQGAIMTCCWVLLTEMFPLRVRGLAVGVAGWFSWMSNTATNLLFPLAVDCLGYPVTFGLIACLCCASGTFVWMYVPETRGKSLEMLELEFRGETTTFANGGGNDVDVEIKGMNKRKF